MTTTWDVDLAKRVGKAIKKHREAQTPKLSAAKLAERTTEIGYEVTKATISELELGRKRSVTIAELIALARALDIPPVELLFPDMPDGSVEAWPGQDLRAIRATQWFSGEITANDASDYVSEFTPEEQDSQTAGIESLKLARQLEIDKSRYALVRWDLDLAKDSNDDGLVADAEQRVAAYRKSLLRTLVRILGRSWSVDPSLADMPADVYRDAWEIVRRQGEDESHGETTASAPD